MAIVKVAFKTAIQKFAVGAEVSEQDELSPHTFESLKDGGFIGEKVEDKPASTPVFGKRFVAPSAEE